MPGPSYGGPTTKVQTTDPLTDCTARQQTMCSTPSVQFCTVAMVCA